MSEETLEQLKLLANRVDVVEESAVTREEFDELRTLVQRLATRLEEVAPIDQIPDEHLAIMSAVFAATIGRRFRIRQVQHVAEPGGWAQTGRVNLHAQRHVRRS
jgi:hypothetical protein